MKAEALLKKEHIPVQLIPIPRTISSDCGIALEVSQGDKERIKRLLKDNELNIDEIHEDNNTEI
jgi:hypothetical protein